MLPTHIASSQQRRKLKLEQMKKYACEVSIASYPAIELMERPAREAINEVAKTPAQEKCFECRPRGCGSDDTANIVIFLCEPPALSGLLSTSQKKMQFSENI